MGRRGSMRGRSGVLFVSVFAVGLIIFYMSWRSLISPVVHPSVNKMSNNQKPEVHFSVDLSKNQLDSRDVMGDNEERDPDYQDPNENSFAKQKKPIPIVNEELNKINDQDSFEKIVAMEKQREKQSTKKYYKSFENVGKTVKSMARLVHLDLKGAAPKMSYLRKLVPLMAKLGATGLLVEYEDMFPYSGALQNISALNSYTMEQINEFLTLARNYSLAVIPLIQTFGHMEFVLKNTFKNLRESAYTPQVIDITANSSYVLIREMIRQILKAHPDATHLHIGCDEVYELGRGASALWKDLDKETLFLKHVSKVANIVKEESSVGKNKVMPIIWDDELRKTPSDVIMSYKLPSLVEIMVWHYGGNVLEKVNMSVWDKYSTLFKTVWIASAFKGATGSRQFYTEPWFHIQNHFSWLEVISLNSRRLTFQGIALTGWSRYDHFATLCELLPVALPSLAVCLATMTNAGLSEAAHRAASDMLQCRGLIEIDFPEMDNQRLMAKVSQDCRFPGYSVYYAMQELYGYTQINTKHRIEGWLSDYQISHSFSNPGQLKTLGKVLNSQSSGISKVKYALKENLLEYFSQDTVDEWIEENIEERKVAISNVLNKIKLLLEPNVWPRRPLTPLRDRPPVNENVLKRESLPINYDKKGDNDKQGATDQGKVSQDAVTPPPNGEPPQVEKGNFNEPIVKRNQAATTPSNTAVYDGGAPDSVGNAKLNDDDELNDKGIPEGLRNKVKVFNGNSSPTVENSLAINQYKLRNKTRESNLYNAEHSDNSVTFSPKKSLQESNNSTLVPMTIKENVGKNGRLSKRKKNLKKSNQRIEKNQ